MALQCEHVQGDAEGEDVRVDGERPAAVRLLRRPETSRSGRASRGCDVRQIQVARETDIDEHVSPVTRADDVRWLDVAVDNAAGPERRDAGPDLCADGD